MRNEFTKAIETVRKTRRHYRLQLALELAGGVIALVLVSVNIENGAHWLATTVGGLVVAFWARQALITEAKIKVATEDEQKLQTMLDAWDGATSTLRDLGLPTDLMSMFGVPPATSTSTDEDTDNVTRDDTAGPAPTSDDASQGTKA